MRIGGSLGRFGNKLKRGAGKVLSNPVGQLAAGLLFGPAGAAISGLAGDVLDTSDGKFDFSKAGRRAALTYGGGKVLQKFGGPLLRKVGGGDAVAEGADEAVQATGKSGLPFLRAGEGAVPETIGTMGGTDLSRVADPSRFRRVTSGVGDFIGKHKDSIIDYGAAAEGLYDRNRERGFQDEARDDWRRRRALRDRSQALLLDEERPDLSGITADPNLRYRRVSAGGY